jgi:hypothetical protein
MTNEELAILANFRQKSPICRNAITVFSWICKIRQDCELPKRAFSAQVKYLSNIASSSNVNQELQAQRDRDIEAMRACLKHARDLLDSAGVPSSTSSTRILRFTSRYSRSKSWDGENSSGCSASPKTVAKRGLGKSTPSFTRRRYSGVFSARSLSRVTLRRDSSIR